MYGEDSSGRKVSLLNNDDTCKKLSRPRLLSYSHKSRSSISSSMSREDFHSLSSSSNSVSPGISPSTPQQLFHLDSLASLETRSTPSPMTPGEYHPYELDQSNTNPNKNSSPYYTYNRPPNPTPGGYPAMAHQDPVPQPYYHINSHQDMVDHTSAYPHAHHSHQQLRAPALQPLHTRFSSAQSSALYSNNNNTNNNNNNSVAEATALASLSSPQTSLSLSSSSSSAAMSHIPQPPPPPPHHHHHNSVSSPTTATNTPTGSKPQKKKYPCPHAARYACRDTFTTSGHAARHGKKHTGEKNIHCPTCNKAFTRKDNMKQHERTHKPSRMESNSNNAGSAPSPTTTSAAAAAAAISNNNNDNNNNNNHTEFPSAAPAISSSTSSSRRRLAPPRSRSTSQPLPDREHQYSPDLSIRPPAMHPHPSSYSSSSGGDHILSYTTTTITNASPQHRRRSSRSEDEDEDEDGEGESPGLDALATAASVMVDA